MEQTAKEHQTTNTSNPRIGFIAFLLSLLVAGLGQVYNGQLKKALIFYGSLRILPLAFGLTRGTTTFYGLLFFFALEIAFRIYVIIDSVKHAKRQREYVLKPYNTWYYHLLIAIGMLAISMIYSTATILGTQTFDIPTTSNNPTFNVGDRLIADMKAYRDKEPDYGDLAVFSRPDGLVYTFRVIGLPGDKIELTDNIASINGKPGKAKFIKETTIDGIEVLELEEGLPNGHKHLIYRFKQPGNDANANLKNIVVPSDCYYLLGDNRDNALDSRYQGFIRRDRIKGRIIYSIWGQTGTQRMNIDFRDK